MVGAGAAEFMQALADIQGPEGLPKSQLYTILRAGRDRDMFKENPAGWDDFKTKVVNVAFERSDASTAAKAAFGKAALGGGSAAPLIAYQRVAELLDYFPPPRATAIAPASGGGS